MAKRTQVIVVSLASETERRIQFSRNAESPFEYFDALKQPPIGLNYDSCASEIVFGRKLRAGEIGCYSSHFAIWQKLCADDSFDRYIVLEDDVIVDWKFIDQLMVADLPGDIGYLRLYYKRSGLTREVYRRFIRRDSNIIRVFGYIYGTQGYVITKEKAREFLVKFNQLERPIDNALDRTWVNGIKNYSVFPFPILERCVKSTIGLDRFSSDQVRQYNILILKEQFRYQISKALFYLRLA